MANLHDYFSKTEKACTVRGKRMRVHRCMLTDGCAVLTPTTAELTAAHKFLRKVATGKAGFIVDVRSSWLRKACGSPDWNDVREQRPRAFGSYIFDLRLVARVLDVLPASESVIVEEVPGDPSALRIASRGRVGLVACMNLDDAPAMVWPS